MNKKYIICLANITCKNIKFENKNLFKVKFYICRAKIRCGNIKFESKI